MVMLQKSFKRCSCVCVTNVHGGKVIIEIEIMSDLCIFILTFYLNSLSKEMTRVVKKGDLIEHIF